MASMKTMLSEEAMERGLNCLSLFAERLQGFALQASASWDAHAAPGANARSFSNARKR
jgi:hypothetical protein